MLTLQYTLLQGAGRNLTFFRNLFLKPKFFLIESDLSDISSIKNKLEQLKDINIDWIINCAGIIDIQKLKKTTYDKF